MSNDLLMNFELTHAQSRPPKAPPGHEKCRIEFLRSIVGPPGAKMEIPVNVVFAFMAVNQR